jgi:hypothetical protein
MNFPWPYNRSNFRFNSALLYKHRHRVVQKFRSPRQNPRSSIRSKDFGDRATPVTEAT